MSLGSLGRHSGCEQLTSAREAALLPQLPEAPGSATQEDPAPPRHGTAQEPATAPPKLQASPAAAGGMAEAPSDPGETGPPSRGEWESGGDGAPLLGSDYSGSSGGALDPSAHSPQAEQGSTGGRGSLALPGAPGSTLAASFAVTSAVSTAMIPLHTRGHRGRAGAMTQGSGRTRGPSARFHTHPPTPAGVLPAAGC